MTAPTHRIDDIDLFVDGDGPHTVVMIHGWPDSHRLWDSSVAALQSRYRCVRFTLPGFALGQPPRPTSLAQMTDLFRRIVDLVSPDRPVTLLLHDWGCIFGYEFATRHPSRVARMLAVDIGDYNTPQFISSLTGRAKLGMFAYQFWLAIAWKLGGLLGDALGNWMTRTMAKKMRCPNPPEAIVWPMNYPYAMRWFGLLGGFKDIARVDPTCPVCYIYGGRKPFMFHSPQWLERLATQAGCKAQKFNTGHWVMVEQPAEFTACVSDWLATTER